MQSNLHFIDLEMYVTYLFDCSSKHEVGFCNKIFKWLETEYPVNMLYSQIRWVYVLFNPYKPTV